MSDSDSSVSLAKSSSLPSSLVSFFTLCPFGYAVTAASVCALCFIPYRSRYTLYRNVKLPLSTPSPSPLSVSLNMYRFFLHPQAYYSLHPGPDIYTPLDIKSYYHFPSHVSYVDYNLHHVVPKGKGRKSKIYCTPCYRRGLNMIFPQKFYLGSHSPENVSSQVEKKKSFVEIVNHLGTKWGKSHVGNREYMPNAAVKKKGKGFPMDFKGQNITQKDNLAYAKELETLINQEDEDGKNIIFFSIYEFFHIIRPSWTMEANFHFIPIDKTDPNPNNNNNNNNNNPSVDAWCCVTIKAPILMSIIIRKGSRKALERRMDILKKKWEDQQGDGGIVEWRNDDTTTSSSSSSSSSSGSEAKAKEDSLRVQ